MGYLPIFERVSISALAPQEESAGKHREFKYDVK